jgi:hypothetical protein
MIRSSGVRVTTGLGAACAMILLLGGCGTTLGPTQTVEEPVVPEIPATIKADQLVGRWGLASFQNPKDEDRVEAAARTHCKQPYVIGAGTSGGVIMHLADEATPQELRLKGSPGGKNYIGPPGPPGGEKDREIMSFDGKVLITKFMDPDAAERYGNMVYVRCSGRA